MYPDLNTFRRAVVPIFERNEQRWFGQDIMFSKQGQDHTYVGVITDKSVEEVVAELRSMENVYSRNLAALKWRETPAGERVYERASYAFCPGGFFGKYQFHVRLWPHEEGVAVWAHHELNPWVHPKAHYAGKEWNVENGAAWVHDNFNVVTTIDKNGVTKQ